MRRSLCGGALLLTTVLALAGCIPTAPLITPDGRYGYSIDCSTEIFSWAGCFDKAGQLCGAAGFTIVNQPDCASTRRTLVIACKGPCPHDVPGVVCPDTPERRQTEPENPEEGFERPTPP